jgi:hypothetical protein
MSDRDFVVKNGLQVNNGVWIVNTAGIFYNSSQWANSTFFNFQANSTLTANNANNLGGVAASGYLRTTGNYTLSGNISFIGSNIQFSTFNLGSNNIANTSGFYSDGERLSGSGGGYYKGNDGTFGDPIRKNNLYKINGNTQTANVTIVAGDNSFTVGPITIQEGYNLTVQEGGRVVII